MRTHSIARLHAGLLIALACLSAPAVHAGRPVAQVQTADGVWQQLFPSSSPSPREGDAVGWDPVSGRLTLFGGFDGLSQRDTWLYDFGAQNWHRLNARGPQGRWGHSMVYDPTHHVFLLFGGFQGDTNPQGSGLYFNDVWAFNPASRIWRQVPAAGTPPGNRRGHCAAYDAANDRMIVFGGFNNVTGFFNDTWQLSLTSNPPVWTQLLPFSPPSGRNGVSGVYDPVRQRMVVFGGSDCCVNYAEAWALDLSTTDGSWSLLQTQGTAPSRRTLSSASYDPLRDRMIVFGGAALPTVFGDALALDLATNTWQTLSPSGTPPGGRSAFGSAFDEANDRLIVFGGSENLFYEPYRNDTWMLSFGGSSASLDRHEPPALKESSGSLWNARLVSGGAEVSVPAVSAAPARVNVYTVTGRLVWSANVHGTTGGATLHVPPGVVHAAELYLATCEQNGQRISGKFLAQP